MYTQFKVLLFLFVLNIVSYGAMNALTSDNEPIVPFVQYSMPLNRTFGGTIEETEQQFNATEIVDEWDTSPDIGIPLFGDIYYVAVGFVKRVRFLIDGWAMTIEWCGSFIPGTGGQTALDFFAWIIRAIAAIFGGTLLFEIISGRKLMP